MVLVEVRAVDRAELVVEADALAELVVLVADAVDLAEPELFATGILSSILTVVR